MDVNLWLDRYVEQEAAQVDDTLLTRIQNYIDQGFSVLDDIVMSQYLCQQGPLTHGTFEFLNQGGQLDTLIGKRLQWSTESASDLTKVCMEGLGSAAKAVWDKIVAAFKWLADVVRKIFGRSKDDVKKTAEIVADVKETFEETTKQNSNYLREIVEHDASSEYLEKLKKIALSTGSDNIKSSIEKFVKETFDLESEFLRVTSGATKATTDTLDTKLDTLAAGWGDMDKRLKTALSKAEEGSSSSKNQFSGEWIREYINTLEKSVAMKEWLGGQIKRLDAETTKLSQRLSSMSSSSAENIVSARSGLRSLWGSFRISVSVLSTMSRIVDIYIQSARALNNKLAAVSAKIDKEDAKKKKEEEAAAKAAEEKKTKKEAAKDKK